MDKPGLKRTDSLCPSPDQLLLNAVKQNDTNLIRKLIRDNPDLLGKIYDHPYNNPILYIAISSFADTVLDDTIQTLIDLGADLYYKNPEDDDMEAIHYAVLGENPSILRSIVKNVRPESVNAVTSYGVTPLLLLIKEGNVESENFQKCLKVLLSTSNVDVNIANSKNQTPIVEAARKGYKDVVTLLLDSGKFVDIDNFKYDKEPVRNLIERKELYDGPLPEYISNNNLNGDEKLFYHLKNCDESSFVATQILDVDQAIPEGTYLQLACQRNLKRAVQHLLRLHADVTKVTAKQESTPIEIAAENGFWKIFEYLLPYYNKIPDSLLTILLKNSINDITVECNHKRCLKTLLESDKPLDVNTFLRGNSALHYASKYTNSNIILNLLSRGASLANRNDYNIFPIEDIAPKTLEQHFDSCIKMTHVPMFDKQSTIVTFDYKTLMPTINSRTNDKIDMESRLINQNAEFTRETDALIELARIPETRYLLKHPLITSLLYLKWHKIRMFFYANLVFYCVFVLSLFLHIFVPKTDDYKFVNSLSIFVLIVTYIVLLLREFTQIMISPKTYFLSFENWLELALIAIVGYIIVEPQNDLNLFKQLSAAAILLSALEMMLLIGQHPMLSTNIVIFRTVSTNFFKFLLWYAILILAFVFSFYKLFSKPEENRSKNSTVEAEGDQDFFAEPDLTFIKIIVMLTGEFDASSLDFNTVSNKLLFLVFVFLIPIILFNLLNGLAVSDTQMIKNDAEIIGYVERINHIVYIENMMLGNLVPSTLLCLFQRCACCCDTDKFKQRTVVKWLARKICLFPYTYSDYKMEMYLYHDGKVKRNLDSTRCKRLKEVYLDGKTVKRVKQMLSYKNDKECYTEEQNTLREQIKILQDTINKLVTNGHVQCKKCMEDVFVCN